ncbi:GAP family protein [Streptomyces sp. TLI_185]|uniref:GAP family protein n=1 Tax=Streptomyces sp. TLI_185 TaxID=2485151 RepID=UPI000F4EB555|nr:GAP family protein [Streptomyces sp. TLI_185]RPF37813.1 Sap-like sulfolipid-1-addressing protein [Streptomyces sp. TLI_185]
MVFDLLLIALAITLDPLPLMAFVLVVASVRGVRTGLAFISGWMTCFVAVIVLVLTVTGGQPPDRRSPPSTANLAIKVAIGVSLVVYGIHRHRKAGHHDPSPTVTSAPNGRSSSFLTSRMDRGALWPAAGLAVLLQPWALVAAGAVTVVEADGSDPTTWLVLIAYCIVATATLLAAELYVVFKPASARHRLRELRSWMQGHAEQAIVYGSVVVGLLLAGKSAYALAH